jgi:methyl-accepting chemotaxis protein
MIDRLTPQERQELRGMIKEAAGSKMRQAAEGDLQKSIRERAKEDLEVLPAQFNKLVKVYYAQNIKDLVDDIEQLAETYEDIFGSEDNLVSK